MKTSALHSKNNNRGILCLVLLLTFNKFSFSQTALTTKVSNLNLELIIPVAFVLVIGLFLFGLFIKQKNH